MFNNNGQGQGENPATTRVDEAGLDDDDYNDDDENEDEQSVNKDNTLIAPQPLVDVHLTTTIPLPTNLSGDVSPVNRHQPRGHGVPIYGIIDRAFHGIEPIPCL